MYVPKFKCRKCSKYFNSKLRLVRHLNSRKKVCIKKESLLHKCSCGKSFLSAKSLSLHQNRYCTTTTTVKNLAHLLNRDKQFQCHYCEAKFTRKESLRRHWRNTCRQYKLVQVNTRRQIPRPQVTTNYPLTTPCVCGKVISIRNISNHLCQDNMQLLSELGIQKNMQNNNPAELRCSGLLMKKLTDNAFYADNVKLNKLGLVLLLTNEALIRSAFGKGSNAFVLKKENLKIINRKTKFFLHIDCTTVEGRYNKELHVTKLQAQKISQILKEETPLMETATLFYLFLQFAFDVTPREARRAAFTQKAINICCSKYSFGQFKDYEAEDIVTEIKFVVAAIANHYSNGKVSLRSIKYYILEEYIKIMKEYLTGVTKVTSFTIYKTHLCLSLSLL